MTDEHNKFLTLDNLNEIIDKESKTLLKKYFSLEEIINTINEMYNYNIWELNEIKDLVESHLNQFLENIPKRDLEKLFKIFIKIIYHPQFINSFEDMLLDIKNEIGSNVKTKEAKNFVVLFENFIYLLSNNNPSKKINILKLLNDEYKNSIEKLPIDSMAFRFLKDIEKDNDKIRIYLILNTYEKLIESRYYSYIELIYNILQECKITSNKKMKTSRKAKKLNNIFNNNYPDYKSLITMKEITIRNANAHGNIKFNKIDKQLILHANNYEKIIKFDEFVENFNIFVEKFIPHGALFSAISKIQLTFLTNNIDYLKNLFNEQRNSAKIKEIINS